MMTSLFNAGQRPAIDAGLSVSRVGSAAQTKAIKKMSGSLKLELAQFRELDAFSQFGSDLDKETKDILSHGKKVMSIIKQNQHMPLTHENEVLLLFAIKEKIIRWIPEQSIEEFKNEIFKFFADKPVLKKIRELKDVTDEIKDELNKEFNKLVGDFVKHIPNYNLGFESE